MMNFVFSEDRLTARVRDHRRLQDGSILASIDFFSAGENIWTHRFNPTDAIQRGGVAEELASRTGLDRTGLAQDLHRFEQAITATYENRSEEDWSAMGIIPDAPSVPSLPTEMVPEALRDWVVDVAKRACFPLEFVTVPAIIGAGAVVGRGVGIMPARFDDFLVVPNLWGGIVGRSGLMKTYAVEEGIRPVSRLAATARERFEKARTALAAKLTEGAISDGSAVRDIAQHHWSGLTTSAAVHGALGVLEGAGWLRIETRETGGRPTEVVCLHPSLRSRRNA